MKKGQTREVGWVFLGFLLLALLANVVMIAPYLLALFLGWIFSTVLSPFYGWMLTKSVKKERAGLLATLAALFAIIIPIVIFGFALVKNLIRIIGPYAKTGVNVDGWIERIYGWPLIHRIFDGHEELKIFMDENTKKLMESVANGLSTTLGQAPAFVLQLVLALLTCYYVLIEGRTLRKWLDGRIPLPEATKAHFVKRLNDMAYSSFLSMLAAATVQSLVVFIGFLVLGVPMAPLAFGVAFVFAWLPIFGVTPVWIGATIYLFANDQVGAGVGMIVFGIIAGLSDNVVRPWVLKGRSDLHPLISLVAIFGSIIYFGIMGVLVGPVVAASLIVLLEEWPRFARDLDLPAEDLPQQK